MNISLTTTSIKRLAIAFAVAMLLILGGTALRTAAVYADCDPTTGSIGEGVDCAIEDDKKNEIFVDGGIFQTIVNTLLFLVGAISVIMLIIGGIRYVVSSGDQNAVQGAKNTILYAIVGIIVAFLAYGIVRFVVRALDPSS